MDQAVKKRRPNRAQRVVAAARRRQVALGNIHDLPSTRLERGDANNRQSLFAIFPKSGGGEPDRLDLSFLLNFPNLIDHFADAILKWGASKRHTTRYECVRALRYGWFSYLGAAGLSNLHSSEIDAQVMAGFNSWAHSQIKRDGKALHPNTTRTTLGSLRIIFRHMPGWSDLREIVPAGPRGALKRGVPTKALAFSDMVAVMRAVEKEVLELRDRLEAGRRLLEIGREYIRQGKQLVKNPQQKEEARSEANIALALAMLDERYPGIIPDRSVIQKDDSLLAWTLNFALGSAKSSHYLYATSRDLVPLVLSIAAATAFNPSTLLKLCWSNIKRNVDRLDVGHPQVQFSVIDDGQEGAGEEEHLGHATTLVKIKGEKPRASRQIVCLLDAEAPSASGVSLNLVLDLLEALTARIRPQVADKAQYADRVFLFVPQRSAKLPRGFGFDSRTADMPWVHALRTFIVDNNLPSFTLKSIRASILDYAQLFNAGDLEAARQAGNHTRRATTWTYYTSDLAKRLLQESTAETMLLRDRWITSQGKLDPRPFRNWTHKGCATPGWVCLDPFDSPRPNQKMGRMCTAYGECPDCPLAAASPNNSHNVMLYEALRRAIYRSITSVTTAVWRERWAPVVAALDAMLEYVSPSVLQEARNLVVELPDVG